MRKRPLGSFDADHVAQARHNVKEAWDALERMPPTCYGGIQTAARALAYAERAQGQLASIEDRKVREDHTEIFGAANRAAKAAHETVQFFAGVCQAPGREAGDRPLFSRARDESARKRKRRK
jgi:hypothetical protein